MYTLDTNAIIYYLKRDEKATRILQNILGKNSPLYVSAITETELFGYPDLTSDEAKLIETMLKAVFVIPVDSRLARLAGSIRRQYRLKTSDAVIAATAIFTGSSLVTRNTADFRKVPALNISSI